MFSFYSTTHQLRIPGGDYWGKKLLSVKIEFIGIIPMPSRFNQNVFLLYFQVLLVDSVSPYNQAISKIVAFCLRLPFLLRIASGFHSISKAVLSQ